MATEQQAEAAIKKLKAMIEAAENSNQHGEDAVVAAAAGLDSLAALSGLLADVYEIFASPEQLEMAAELARKGRPAIAADSDGPDTIKAARDAIARAEGRL